MENALCESLAGAIESDHPSREDYKLALKWVNEEQARRGQLDVDG